MKKTRSTAALAAVIVGAVMASTAAHAQTSVGSTPPVQRELDPAKRIPASPPTDWRQAQQPAVQSESGSDAQARQHVAVPEDSAGYADGRGGFFVGVQSGKGWVYEDVDQTGTMLNAGYRWQAGPVALVGVELAGGRLGSTDDAGYRYSAIDYASIGVNARFNFGRSNPVYGLVRAGYWSAEDDESGGDVDGGYVGLGLGVDINRHFNMSLAYTNYVYFEDYYWEGDDFNYDINRADMLMLGAEVRF